MAPMCTPYIERQIWLPWLPWQCPLCARYWQYLQSVGWPLKSPSITNCLVAIVHTKPVIAILVPKLVAMAMTLRHLISALLAIIQPKLIYSLSKAKKPVIANCIPKWLPWQRPSASLDSHLTHDYLGPSQPTTQTASQSVQPFLHRWQ